MDTDNLYDEFGNYIGPELEDSDNDDIDGEDFENNGNGIDFEDEVEERRQNQLNQLSVNVQDNMEIDENRIILHEDKKYFPDASEIYPGVRTVTLDEDAQDLSEPIVKPIKIKNFSGKIYI
jgi:U5 small nuclear ribonucleoprotein component